MCVHESASSTSVLFEHTVLGLVVVMILERLHIANIKCIYVRAGACLWQQIHTTKRKKLSRQFGVYTRRRCFLFIFLAWLHVPIAGGKKGGRGEEKEINIASPAVNAAADAVPLANDTFEYYTIEIQDILTVYILRQRRRAGKKAGGRSNVRCGRTPRWEHYTHTHREHKVCSNGSRQQQRRQQQQQQRTDSTVSTIHQMAHISSFSIFFRTKT